MNKFRNPLIECKVRRNHRASLKRKVALGDGLVHTVGRFRDYSAGSIGTERAFLEVDLQALPCLIEFKCMPVAFAEWTGVPV